MSKAARWALGVAAVVSAAVAASTFRLSFGVIRAVAVGSGLETPSLLPVTIDGAMIVGTLAYIVVRHTSGKFPVTPAVAIGAGALLSMACGMIHAASFRGADAGGVTVSEPGKPPVILDLSPAAAMFVSALPALSLAVTVHLTSILVASAVVRREPPPPEKPKRPTKPAAGPKNPEKPKPEEVVDLTKPAPTGKVGRPPKVDHTMMMVAFEGLSASLGRRPTGKELGAAVKLHESRARAWMSEHAPKEEKKINGNAVSLTK